MPLLNIHIHKGRSLDEIDLLADTIHEVVVESFKVPMRDRYQILHEHEQANLRALDTGLGYDRTELFVLIDIRSRPRPRAMKLAFYACLAVALRDKCGIASTDIMISMVENTDEDWSFGLGKAEFVTGEL